MKVYDIYVPLFGRAIVTWCPWWTPVRLKTRLEGPSRVIEFGRWEVLLERGREAREYHTTKNDESHRNLPLS